MDERLDDDIAARHRLEDTRPEEQDGFAGIQGSHTERCVGSHDEVSGACHEYERDGDD